MGDNKENGRQGDDTGRKRKMPELLVEQKALGELPPGMEAELERLLDADDTVDGRLADVERSNREILEQYPPGPMAARIKRRAEGASRKRARSRGLWLGLWVGLPSLAAAAAAALLVLVPALKPERQGPLGVYGASRGPELVTIKGDSKLKIYRRGQAGVLLPGAAVAAGDDLMVHYVAHRRDPHGAILSLDGRGGVSLHFPASPDGSTRLTHGGEQAVEHSFELDDAPGFERFFLVTSKQSIDVRAVRKSLEALGKAGDRAVPRLPQGVVLQHDVLLRKKPAQVTP